MGNQGIGRSTQTSALARKNRTALTACSGNVVIAISSSTGPGMQTDTFLRNMHSRHGLPGTTARPFAKVFP